MRWVPVRLLRAATAATIAIAVLAFAAAGRRGPLRSARPPEAVILTLLNTTAIHGHIEPFDDLSSRPSNWGLAKIATLVRRMRAEKPNVILLDCDDMIEGTPLAHFFAAKHPGRLNPVVAAMNALDYTAMAGGNHEFNFRLKQLWAAKRQARFPWLAANLRQALTAGPGCFPPFVEGRPRAGRQFPPRADGAARANPLVQLQRRFR